MSEAGPAAAGGTVFRTYTDALLRDMLDTVADCVTLPPHLCRVLEHAAQGLTAAESALKLGIKYDSAETYRRRAMKRLNARSITHAVALALILGLLFTDY